MKNQLYLDLVKRRKRHDYNDQGILNPSKIENGKYDFDHLNAWGQWHSDLNAEILLIGQDFGDEDYFINNKGKDDVNNPTNRNLNILFKEAGIDIGTTELPINDTRLYFTNAVLGIKRNGGMAGKIKNNWYLSTADSLIKPLINLIEPRIIITLGTIPYEVICKIYGLTKKPLKLIIDENPIRLSGNKRLFALYHCSGLGLANRSFEKQKNDWGKIKNVR